MPLEFGLWHIEGGFAAPVVWGEMDFEARLEDILDADITIASPNWMVIGRQVQTDHGGWIDLLAIDRDGNLVVIELKRAKTPRDIVAQTLDYGSWVSELTDVAIAKIFESYLKSRHPERGDQSIAAPRSQMSSWPVSLLLHHIFRVDQRHRHLVARD